MAINNVIQLLLYYNLFSIVINICKSQCNNCGYGGLCVNKKCHFIGSNIYEEKASDGYNTLIKHCLSAKCEEENCTNTYGSFYCYCGLLPVTSGKKCENDLGDSPKLGFQAEGLYVFYPIKLPKGNAEVIYISLQAIGTELTMDLNLGKIYSYSESDLKTINVAEKCRHNSDKMPKYYDKNACHLLINGDARTWVLEVKNIPELIQIGQLDGKELKSEGSPLPFGRIKKLELNFKNTKRKTISDEFYFFVQFHPSALKCFPRFTLNECSSNKANPLILPRCINNAAQIVYDGDECSFLEENFSVSIKKESKGEESKKISLPQTGGKTMDIPLLADLYDPGSHEITVSIRKSGGKSVFGYNENMTERKRCWVSFRQCTLKTEITGGIEQTVQCEKPVKLEVVAYAVEISSLMSEGLTYKWTCDKESPLCNENVVQSSGYFTGNLECLTKYTFRVEVIHTSGMTGETSVVLHTFKSTPFKMKCKENCQSKVDPRVNLVLEGTLEEIDTEPNAIWELYKNNEKIVLKNMSLKKSQLVLRTSTLEEGETYLIKATYKEYVDFRTIQIASFPTKGTVDVSPQEGLRRLTEFTFTLEGFSGDVNESLTYQLREKDDYDSAGNVIKESTDQVISNIRLAKPVVGIVALNTLKMPSDEAIVEVKLINPSKITPDDFDRDSPEGREKIMDFLGEGSLEGLSPEDAVVLLKELDSNDVTGLESAEAAVRAVSGVLKMHDMTKDEQRALVAAASEFLLDVLDVVKHFDRASLEELTRLGRHIAEAVGSLFEASIDTRVAIDDDSIPMEEREAFITEEITLSLNLVSELNEFTSNLGSLLETGEELEIETDVIEILLSKQPIDDLVGREFRMDDGNASFSIGETIFNTTVTVQAIVYEVNPFYWSEMDHDTDVLSVEVLGENGEEMKTIPIEFSLEMKTHDLPVIHGRVHRVERNADESVKNSHVRIHKFFAKDGDPALGMIHVEFLAFRGSLLVAALIDEIPDYAYVKSNGKLVNKTSHEFYFDANDAPFESIFYIGVITENIRPSSYSFKMSNAQCLSWAYNNWADTNCKVKLVTSNTMLHCRCSHMSIFSGKLFTPPNVINPIADIHLFKQLLENPFILIVVLALAVIVIILLIWARLKDRNEKKMRLAYLLEDSISNGEGVYLIGVYTGPYLFAGTSANVCIQVKGSDGESMVHLLKLSDRKVLQVGQDDWFMFYTPKPLGAIKEITLFHDDSGPSPDWYCKKIVIYDINEDDVYSFEVAQWLSIMKLNEDNELLLKVSLESKRQSYLGPDTEKKDMVTSNIVIGIRNAHSWISIFLRHPRAVFTRCQLVMTGAAVLSVAMLVSMMFFGVLEEQQEDLPRLEVTLSNIILSVQAFLIAFPITFLILFFFEKPTRKKSTSANESRASRMRKTMLLQQKRGLAKRFMSFAKDQISANIASFPLLPVTAGEEESLGRKEKIWLAVAWTFSLIVTITCCFFMVFYSLKFGKNKSLQWLYSFTIGWAQDFFFIEPFKVIILAVVLGVLLQRVASVDSYHFEVLNVRKPKEEQTTEPSRDNAIYKPLTPEMVKEHRYKREKDDFLRWLFVRLMPTIALFLLTALMAWRSSVYGIHYEVRHIRSLMECPAGAGACTHDIHTKSSYLQFIKAALPNYCSMSSYLESDYEGDVCNPVEPKLLGVPRVRQQRVEPNCSGVSALFREIFDVAHGELMYETEDVKKYFVGWIEFDEKSSKSRPVWNYLNYLNTTTASYYGPTQILRDGGGYIEKLKQNSIESRKQLFILERYNWIDEKTRVTFLEVNTYNPHANVFVVAAFLAEHHASGVCTTRLIVDGGEFTSRNENDPILVVIASLLVVFYVQLLVLLFTDVSRLGFFSALKQKNIILDVFCVIAGGVCIFTWVSRVAKMSLYLDDFLERSEDEFVSFSYPKNHDNLFSIALGLFSLFLALKVKNLLIESFAVRFFRGFIFIKPSIVIYLFVIAVYCNTLFTILTSYFGCPSYKGFVHFVHDTKNIMDILKETNVAAEYWLTIITAYWFVFFKVFCVAIVICLHKEAIGYVGADWNAFRYQIGNYFGGKVSTLMITFGIMTKRKIYSEPSPTRTNKRKPLKGSDKAAKKLLPAFKELDKSLELRIKRLSKINSNLDEILEHIDKKSQ